MKNHRIIQVKFMPVTNRNGARIKLTESRFKKTDTQIISFHTDNMIEDAISYLKSIDINVSGFGTFKNEQYIFSDSWANENGFFNIKGKTE